MPALRIHAGALARERLRECGLRAEDIAIVPAAAGGPKGLVLNPLDRFLFGHWLASSPHRVHLLGASIGACRMACACRSDADRAFAELADDYIGQRYEHAPGRPPQRAHVSAVFGAMLGRRFDAGHAAEVLSHPQRRLHVFVSRGRHLLGREGRRLSSLSTPLGYLGAFATNALSRRAMGGWLERVIFSDPRDALPLPLADYRTQRLALTAENLSRALLASCSIPFWLDAVRDIPGAPPGAYWDGGITDYHLHLDYAALAQRPDRGRAEVPGLVLYPHFQDSIIPGWLDKALTHRHRPATRLDNVVLLAPDPQWVAETLPSAKLPDRGDFKRYADDVEGRIAAWRRALAESQRLADEFVERVADGRPIDAEPLCSRCRRRRSE